MYLLDSDAARKLCQYELLNELVAALGCSMHELGVLPQLKFQLQLADHTKSLARLGSINAVELAKRLIASAHEVEVSAATANPLLELNRPDIDTGEAILFAALWEDAESELISGDKRAFVALSKVDGVAVIDALWGRLICLEESLYLMVRDGDFHIVSQKVRSRPDVDISASNSFGRSTPSTQPNVLDALQSYMAALKRSTNGKYVLP
ncbi:hypothetical protein HU755_23980 [Pseudomonas sp. SWRI111]|uniref:hypothetical protein n=1 Tax=Pseudomonas sp. SWRI111 TaxID=2745507 RepID=UPI001648D070|nr:hypothetical protein [Pseudomonas sp. SWRI111]MBC3209871.1 hypothetical protein [Pseudomonas sp. SWRI111]